MLKRDELLMPDSCLNRARDDEFIFVLLERDDACPETIRFWARKRVERGKNRPMDAQIVRALAAADRIEQKAKRLLTECSGHERGGKTTCCDRAGEYNGFASGPTIFTCPKGCSCHD